MSLWDLYQHAQLRGMRASQRMADSEGLLRDRRIERETDALEQELEQLALVVEALWSVCRDQLGLSDEALVAAIGQADARRQAVEAAGPVRCPKCSAAVGHELDHCQFCGEPSPRPPSPFE
jgi:hypothetical protein